MSNFLILVSDEHNPLYSSPYGHEAIKTPNMEALANIGVVFENAYCPSPLCLPSRSAFMSGKRVHEIQTYSNCNALLDPTPLSFGAALAKQDVHSAYIGKTDVYAPGAQLGFSEMMMPGDRKLPGDRNNRRNPMTIRESAHQRADGFGPKEKAGAHDVDGVDEAVKWIQDTAPKLKTPWVMTVNIGNPHFPHYASPELWDMYPDGGDLPKHGMECESARHPYAKAIRAHFKTEGFTEEQARGLRRGYLACVTFVDRQLGRLVEALNATGLRDTTNVAYSSDHGDMLGKFGMWWKCSLYEDAARIPMIAAGPDFPKGQRTTTPVDLHDLQAAMFKATGTKQPDGWLGTPLQDIPESDPERVVFAEYHGHGAPGSAFMVRKGKWKYICYHNAEAQLFDLEGDPEELTNLAASKPEVVADMDAELHRVCSPEEEQERAEAFIERQVESIAKAKEDENSS